jgi:hypothetical protein
VSGEDLVKHRDAGIEIWVSFWIETVVRERLLMADFCRPRPAETDPNGTVDVGPASIGLASIFEGVDSVRSSWIANAYLADLRSSS